MATPAVAANAVLVREYFMDGFYPSGKATQGDGFVPSGALIKAVLMHSGQIVQNLVDDQGNVQDISAEYPSSTQGYGRIQLDKVLNFETSHASTSAAAVPVSLFVMGGAFDSSSAYVDINQGQTHTYSVTTSSSTTALRVTLAYTDLYGGVGGNRVLMNNLDLQVTGGSGSTTFLPIPDNANSEIENVEQIIKWLNKVMYVKILS